MSSSNEWNTSRRRVLQTLWGLGTACGVSATTAQAQQSTQQWTQYQYDARNTGYAPDHEGPTGELDHQWEFTTDGEIISAPALGGGNVYAGSLDGAIYAIDANTGTQNWVYRTDGPVRSSPTLVEDAVYVGSDDGAVYKLSASDGSELWQLQIGGEIRRSAPVVTGGTVYIGVFDTGDAPPGVSGFYAIDAETGEQIWQFSGPESDTIHGACTPAVANGTVFVTGKFRGSSYGDVFALSASDGSIEWQFAEGEELPSLRWNSPSVVDGTVFVGLDQMYALNASDGTEKWRFQTDTTNNPARQAIRMSPAVDRESVYVNMVNDLYALDRESGEEQWVAEGMDSLISPIVTRDSIYLGTHILSTETGDTVGEHRHVGSEFGSSSVTSGSHAVGDGVLYYGTSDGRITALAPVTQSAQQTSTRTSERTPTTRRIATRTSESTPREVETQAGEVSVPNTNDTETEHNSGVTLFERFGNSEEFLFGLAVLGALGVSAVGAYRWLNGSDNANIRERDNNR